MHNIGKIVLEAAVKKVVKEGVSAAVRGATKSRANIPTADIQRAIKVIDIILTILNQDWMELQ